MVRLAHMPTSKMVHAFLLACLNVAVYCYLFLDTKPNICSITSPPRAQQTSARLEEQGLSPEEPQSLDTSPLMHDESARFAAIIQTHIARSDSVLKSSDGVLPSTWVPALGYIVVDFEMPFLLRSLESLENITMGHLIVCLNTDNKTVRAIFAKVVNKVNRADRLTVLPYNAQRSNTAGGWNAIAQTAFARPSVKWVWISNSDISYLKGCHLRFAADLNALPPTALMHWFGTYSSFAVSRLAYTSVLGRFDDNVYPAYIEDHEYYARMVSINVNVYTSTPLDAEHFGSIMVKKSSEDSVFSSRMRRWSRHEFIFRKWGIDLVSFPGIFGILIPQFRFPFNRQGVPVTVVLFDKTHRRCLEDNSVARYYNGTSQCVYDVWDELDRRYPLAHYPEDTSHFPFRVPRGQNPYEPLAQQLRAYYFSVPMQQSHIPAAVIFVPHGRHTRLYENLVAARRYTFGTIVLTFPDAMSGLAKEMKPQWDVPGRFEVAAVPLTKFLQHPCVLYVTPDFDWTTLPVARGILCEQLARKDGQADMLAIASVKDSVANAILLRGRAVGALGGLDGLLGMRVDELAKSCASLFPSLRFFAVVG